MRELPRLVQMGTLGHEVGHSEPFPQAMVGDTFQNVQFLLHEGAHMRGLADAHVVYDANTKFVHLI